MASKDRKRPNIVFMLSDDQGAWAMGYAGNKHIITPNFNRLAAEGMTFSNSFLRITGLFSGESDHFNRKNPFTAWSSGLDTAWALWGTCD